MKTLLITLISLYHRFVSPLLWQALGIRTVCRYNQTCSVYAIDAIQTHGALVGLVRAIKRIVSCQPFTKAYVSNN